MKRQRGYTLLEVIVAFALLALALTLLLGTLSGGVRQVRAADQATRRAVVDVGIVGEQRAPQVPVLAVDGSGVAVEHRCDLEFIADALDVHYSPLV